MKRTKEQKAITLIALVIAIIVMLILAGVSIAMLTGENGVLTQATKAKKEMTMAEEQELIKLAYNAALAEKLANNDRNPVTKEELNDKLKENGLEGTATATGENPLTVDFGGKTYTVNSNGNVTLATGGTEEIDGLKWIYSETADGNIEITGLDLSDKTGVYAYSKETTLYQVTMSLGKETLTVPGTIKGKTVVKFDWKDTIFPSYTDLSWGLQGLGFDDVTKIIYADTIKEIANNYPEKDIVFTKVTEVHLPNNLVKLGDWACTRYVSLENITIPESVTSIGYRAFADCHKLKNITLPDNVVSIGDSAFSGCTSLKTITLSENINSMGEYAFSNCIALENFTIPQNIAEIKIGTFGDCRNLKSISIPDTVTVIGDAAFCNCESLQSITLPQKINKISDSMLAGCSSLASINITENIASIEMFAFDGCSSLQNIDISKKVTLIDYKAFRSCGTINFPNGKNDALTIPSDKWGANKVIVSGVEQ